MTRAEYLFELKLLEMRQYVNIAERSGRRMELQGEGRAMLRRCGGDGCYL